MAYMNSDLFYKIIAPLMEVRQTVLIGISTLVNSWNFFSRLMTLKYKDGSTVFNVVAMRMVCDRCISLGDEENCEHNLHLLPPWKSVEKHEMARLIYGDDIQALKRESLGLVDGNAGGLFNAMAIKDLLDAERYDLSKMANKPRFVFVSCDPNGGGPNHMAMVAMIYDELGKLVLVGGESKRTDTDQQEGLLRDFVSKLRQSPYLREAWIVFFCENNGAGSSQACDYARVLQQQYSHIYCVKDIQKNKVVRDGVCTTPERKQDYALELRAHLARRNISVAQQFISANSIPPGDTDSARWMLNAFSSQLRRAQIVATTNNSVGTMAKFVWTAKCRDDGTVDKALSDDILMAACIGVYFSRRFLNSHLPTVDYSVFR